ncbi:hypothetical protein CcaverHIS002_0606050 [Cutaneotrichosporon cavernicola]|uniref:Uncharacterized protein n=1 Tax=Cutaneotrichosporon cavernicola TaxID=279322 RepID=A0AA48L8T8_9TREE|nr:uncharacterized protein CcaverHIS019_0605510 [Cutaneotrichosporon cavernicola]BEI86318.1 hypothetical protein CcaverHIS002_0606050 [Cutaneotrichosporon cavernicola]BEI94092.1 hypothetical protein CcaverHIS019_0605510 [Cutaneotrichosporon cavernicola]BEJ01871.1 hypothetical protein CcaverHIS631_0605530 [Cutaneotrichosporon cavernicola]BEJ09636.1 hypothetical protein CcaverHIS641_0605510 [Cutaneotrichosporon cavernicola]
MPPSPDSEAARASNPQRKGPRKKGRGPHRPSDLVHSSDPQGGADPDGSADDDVFELLGSKPVPSSGQTPGLLQLSKTSMEAAKKSMPKQTARRKPANRDEPRGEDMPTSSEVDRDHRFRRAKNGPADPGSTIEGSKRAVARKPLNDETSGMDTDQSARSGSQAMPSSTALGGMDDMSSLSQSLPASFFAEAQDGRKDAQNLDISPSLPAAGGKALNWQQQQLQNEMTPSKNPKGSGRRASKTPAKTGNKQRRSSLDDVPVSGVSATMQSTTKTPATGATVGSGSPSKTAVPVSNFDSSIPFHTGYNVHRAPQTPLRNNQRSTAVTARDGLIHLPIVGEFPRLNRANVNTTPGTAPIAAGPSSVLSNPAPAPTRPSVTSKASYSHYAGPTFHNSPAGSDLPKPDLDDF